MVRQATLALVAIVALAVAACGGDSSGDATPTDGEASSTTTAESPAASGEATFGDVKLASEINPDTKEPTIEVTSFPSDTKAMHATVNVKNVPAGAQFLFRWSKGTEEARVVVVNVNVDTTDSWVSGSVFPNGPVPAGEDWLVSVVYNGTPIGSVVFSVRDAGG